MVFGVVLLRVGATTSGDASLWMSEVRGALTDRYGAAVGTWFVVGFFATSITTLLGVWQGVSLIVTDFARETWELDVAVSPERSALPPLRRMAALPPDDHALCQ
ncbi:hypothetical protein MMUR_08870 [Mycolicibacterium murale]|uniref:Uncharacterized protein n=2 Tax=Mycolicibacterium murale TaxID=182220 RepID=A0A7I9WG81_9MYCO|nr:hypothetical protein MMUR_08870 [Mycolicibacterium murale]